MISREAEQKLAAALAQHSAGAIDAAAALYREVLDSDPHQADALHMLGVIAQQKGNGELALKLTEAALAVRANMPLAWHNRAMILRAQGRKEEALQSAREALGRDPRLANAWNTCAGLLREAGRSEDAREAYAQALALEPDNAALQADYALFLYATGDLPDAYAILAPLAADPHFVPLTLANVLKSAGYPRRALPYFAKARELLPQNGEIAINEAMAYLQIGDFERGLELWERRPDYDPRFASLPLWRGQEVGHLLLHEDQGFGDALQCARYIPSVCKRAKRVTLQIAPVLASLFAASFPDIEVIPLDQAVPQADARARLFSLPYLFETRLQNIPAGAPYLKVTGKDRAAWRERLSAIKRPRIGLVWGGNPHNRNETLRSIPYENLAPLLAAGAGHLVSLQKGTQRKDIALEAFDADPYLADFSAAAGLLEELDLLISVDTAALHLAGALARPAWGLLPFYPDWRWLLAREDSPWYPSLRLFRQEKPRDWMPVIARAAAELRRFLAGETSVLRPAPWGGPPLEQNPLALELEP